MHPLLPPLYHVKHCIVIVWFFVHTMRLWTLNIMFIIITPAPNECLKYKSGFWQRKTEKKTQIINNKESNRVYYYRHCKHQKNNKGIQTVLCSSGKEYTCNEEDMGSIPGLGRCPEEGKSYLPQYPGLENSMEYIVHGVSKSQTRLSNFHFHTSLAILYT